MFPTTCAPRLACDHKAWYGNPYPRIVSHCLYWYLPLCYGFGSRIWLASFRLSPIVNCAFDCGTRTIDTNMGARRVRVWGVSHCAVDPRSIPCGYTPPISGTTKVIAHLPVEMPPWGKAGGDELHTTASLLSLTARSLSGTDRRHLHSATEVLMCALPPVPHHPHTQRMVFT